MNEGDRVKKNPASNMRTLCFFSFVMDDISEVGQKMAVENSFEYFCTRLYEQFYEFER